ncbi:MAG: efflux RND transporter periplasmic adaptor subunit [Pseudomonadota bacterium]
MALQPVNDAEPTRIRDTAAQDRVVEKPPRPWLAWSAACVVVLLLGAWLVQAAGIWLRTDISVPREQLRTATVTRGEFVQDFAIQGEIVAATKPSMFAPSSGRVTLAVSAGDVVTAGQVVATVASPELEAELRQAEAALAERRTQAERERIDGRQQALTNQQAVDLARVRVTAAERELRRAKASWEYKVIALQDLEKAQDDVETARLEYEHTSADAALFLEREAFEERTRSYSVQQLALVLTELERRQEALTVRSPVAGTVGNLTVEDGAAVVADAALMSVVDLSRLELEIPLAQSYADDVSVGMGASISYNGLRYPAYVAAISPEVVNNSVTTRLRFRDSQPDGLRQNQRLTGTIEIRRLDDVLKIRRGPFYDSGGGRVAYALDGDFAVRTPITTGAASATAIQVLEGLQEGDEIVISTLSVFEQQDQVLLTH